MQSKVPLYPYSAKDAMKRGEIEKWRESFRENCACAGGIDILIRENFDGMHLKDGTVEKIVELYGYKRVEHVLANTVQERRGDGRFRPDNRAWAESHFIPPDEIHNYCFAARSHSAILDGFISNYPDNLNAKATLWLWQLRDLAVIGIGLLIAVLALTQLGLFLPMVLVAAYAFLSIHLDGLSVLDFLSFVVSFYLTEQQLFEWEDPT